MQYLITFLEGIISFISPCMLPMIPLYISYFAGNDNENKSENKALIRSIAFVLGFTIIFCILGIFTGLIGQVLIKYEKIVNVVCGIIVILFGLSYLNIIKISFLKGINKAYEIKSIFSAFVFGMIFSINLTPCTGAFLGTALMLASTSGAMLEGFLLLLTYSLGLGVPFIISAVLIQKLNSTFSFIKKHYDIINKVCGILLIVIGILISFGIINKIFYAV